MKAQAVRLLDVFLIGPLILYASRKFDGIEKAALIATGIGTIVYNGRNYLAIENGKEKATVNNQME